MKKLILFVAMFGMVGFLSAQCSKTAGANKKSCCAKTAAAAATSASLDASIEKKVCEKSGKISYYKSSTCPASGKVTQTEVRYDDKAKQFVNVAEVSQEASTTNAKKECSKKCAKKCSKAKATGVSNETKACAKGSKAACCKKGNGAKSTKTAAKMTSSPQEY